MKILNAYKSLSLPVKATFWFTICNFILKAISFITVPLFARYLSTEEYGIVSVYNSYQQIFMIFATLELSMGAYQRGIIKFKEQICLFTQSIQMLWSFITAVLFIVVFTFRGIFIHLTDTNITILTLMFVYFLVQPAYECWVNRKRFSYDYKSVVFFTIVFTLFVTLIPLGCIIFIDQKAILRIASTLIVQIIFCLPFYLKNINFKRASKNKDLIKGHIKFALSFQLPLLFHSLSYFILAQSDRIMIGAMVGKSEAAIYSVAYSLSNVVIIFQTSINQVLKPWRYQMMEKREYGLISNITNMLLLFFGIFLLLFILIAPEVMKLLFNESYYEAVWTIPPITLSVYFMFLYSIFTDIESYFYKTKYIMYGSVVCAVINIILNYFGIIYFGYISCGYATLISYVIFAIMHYVFMSKSCDESGINTHIFNKKIIIFLSISYIVLTLIFVIIYQIILIRYLIVFVIIILCIFNRKKIYFLVKNIKQSRIDKQ